MSVCDCSVVMQGDYSYVYEVMGATTSASEVFWSETFVVLTLKDFSVE